MKLSFFYLGLFFISLVLLLGGGTVQAEDEPALRAGVAMADIAAPVGVPLAGYGGGKRRLDFPDLDPTNYHTLLAPSEGILDPLIAKAVVLESGSTKIAIIKLDSVGIMDHIVDDIAKKIGDTGITRDQLTVTGTHTHSGPGAMCKNSFWSIFAVDILDERIYDPLIEKLAQLVREANANLQPARFGVGTGLSFDLSRNRRNHPGVIDPVVAVFRIEKADGSPLAVLFNFAVHGTCLGDDNLKMSGDVMGYAERYIEKTLAAQSTPAAAIFINGTQGDVAPAKGGLDGAELVGNALGKKVLEILPGIATQDHLRIAIANHEIAFNKAHLYMDVLNEGRRELPGELSGIPKLWAGLSDESLKIKIEITKMVSLRFRLQALRLGDAVIACVPGEPITNIGTAIKTAGGKIGFTHTFIFGLANGHMGYVTDVENFDEGGYEAMLTIFGRDEGNLIVNSFEELFSKLK
jgi:hypothetical protein